MGVPDLSDDKFSNLLQNCTKVVHVSSANRYYLAVTAKWIKENISGKIRTVYDCYVQRVEASEVTECLASFWFRKYG